MKQVLRRSKPTLSSESEHISRRTVLHSLATATAAATLPASFVSSIARAASAVPRAMPAGSAISPLMTQLSEYMAAARSHDLPQDVAEQAKNHILDTFAAMVSGSGLPPGEVALKFAQSFGGEKIATIAASNILCGPMEAALVNGLLAHSDETDDSHAPSESHPGAPIVPATLATGEKFGID